MAANLSPITRISDTQMAGVFELPISPPSSAGGSSFKPHCVRIQDPKKE